MTTLCPAYWREVPHDDLRCSHCGADIVQLHERDFRDKLFGALSHPVRDTVVRAATILAVRHDPEASWAIELAMRRFSDEPPVLAELLGALAHLADDDARRIGRGALRHRSVIVRAAARRLLARIDQQAEFGR